MPTENEFKYVLDPNTDEDEIRKVTHLIEIRQAYLSQQNNVTVRIRESWLKSHAGSVVYELCVKGTADRVIEIETVIDERDFNDLWEFSKYKLQKTRYVYGNGAWVIDFFKKDGATYFVMAECEVPEDVKEPPDPIPIIADKLVYKGMPSSSKFSSKELSCPIHAAQMLKDIENIKKYLTARSK